MSLDGLLLEKLARWRPDGRQVLDVNDPDSQWALAVTADAADIVGCRLWELTLRRTGNAPLNTDLKKRAEAVAARVTGLMEPLRVIEVDEPRGVALVRSASPTVRGEIVSYYELLLNADQSITMRRFEGPHGEEKRRLQIAFALTGDSLAKLVSDLTA
jgi:hypothetical protein